MCQNIHNGCNGKPKTYVYKEACYQEGMALAIKKIMAKAEGRRTYDIWEGKGGVCWVKLYFKQLEHHDGHKEIVCNSNSKHDINQRIVAIGRGKRVKISDNKQGHGCCENGDGGAGGLREDFDFCHAQYNQKKPDEIKGKACPKSGLADGDCVKSGGCDAYDHEADEGDKPAWKHCGQFKADDKSLGK